MRALSVLSRLCVVAGLALSTTACSSTPDRYAFWRDNAPVSTDATTKPNLADIPANPNVDDARRDMQAMQQKLAADRDSAYAQAQTDRAAADGKMLQAITMPVTDPAPRASATDVRSEILSPVGPANTLNAASSPMASSSVLATNPEAQPVMQNPNRAAGNATWPVYVPPSVQINAVVPTPPLRPYAALQPTPDYVYGRGSAQFRERVAQANPVAAAPGAVPAIVNNQMVNNQNVTVDFSALGLATPNTRPTPGALQAAGVNGVLSGGPAIYFNHGSTRLSQNDRKTLAALAASAVSRRQPVRVVGHASSRTATASPARAKAVNLKISATRATKVMQELAKKGVPTQTIQTTAVGDQDAQTAPSEAAARRVDVLIGP